MRRIKNIVWDFLRFIKLGGGIQLLLKSPMLEDGWFNSFNKKKSIDKNGNPIPWCTYPFLKFIEPRLNKQMEIFEFGAGNSTIWYSSRVKSVLAVEHNMEWIKIIENQLPSNTSVIYQREGENYSLQAELEKKEFDIIIVDGVDRNNCIYNSIKCLKPGGVLLLDNSEREEYLPGINYLLTSGFRKVDFWGLSPIISSYNCTSIFYRDRNCLNI